MAFKFPDMLLPVMASPAPSMSLIEIAVDVNNTGANDGRISIDDAQQLPEINSVFNAIPRLTSRD